MEQKVKGISLITLVITIIIIIILAGAIILSLTNSDVIGKAGMAKASNDFAQIRQMVEMAKADVMLNDGIVNVAVPAEYANDIHVSTKGGIFLKPGGTKITDAEIVEKAMTVMGAAYLPTGFAHLEGTIDEGIVIIDITEGPTEDNEFVWVPVLNIDDFLRENYRNESNWDGFKEYGEILPEEDQPEEYKAMRESVKLYKGFYVARYEAGIADDSKKATQDGSVLPISKQNAHVWNNIRWGGSGNEIAGYAGDPSVTGTVMVARAMYPVASATTGKPVSTLIYGVQWDAAMRYMENVPNITDTSKKYILDSTNMGNYHDSNPNNNPAKTGDKEYPQYKVKNIYDMAGNVSELTMEAYDDNRRVVRSGSYSYNLGASSPASSRAAENPISSSQIIGFRTALYIVI